MISKDGAGQHDLNLQYGSWLRAPVVTPNQARGLRRNGVELVASGAREQCVNTGQEKSNAAELMVSSPLDRNSHKITRKDWEGSKANEKDIEKHMVTLRMKVQLELLRGNFWTVSHMMEGCLAMDSDGKSGGLALLWRDGINVSIQNYSKFHIDSLVRLEDDVVLRFTGFYGQSDPSSRLQAWNMLRRVHCSVNEGWIIGGDFNAILNDSEKEGGQRKPNVLMEEFSNILKELKLVDVKPCNGWFWFRYDTCWAEDQELKDILTSIWSKKEGTLLEKMKLTRDKLGPWQYNRFRKLKYKIKWLEKEISRLMDGRTNAWTQRLLKQARGRLGHLYDVEEKYWALRAQSQWLREGDRNTRYFHVRASGRRRKNTISSLKDEH
ncbi:hypothetical protein GOBAR_AA32532 [Gossypium barbadense]|uniref:Endonuclease/exonuclease/phosphatase domain-containing protein n=1 Tax=Gossypium barbadense TaxID=3634 RepID=A0A2P5WAR4_GOSBA|nr:hypothetical protein GOBAR_AA32532 [Gossypium barbadense]